MGLFYAFYADLAREQGLVDISFRVGLMKWVLAKPVARGRVSLMYCMTCTFRSDTPGDKFYLYYIRDLSIGKFIFS